LTGRLDTAVTEIDPRVVLVVDDEEMIRTLVEVTLRRGPYRVVTAGDGEAALTAARAHRPDAVVLDVTMPGRLDGVDVCRRIKGEAATRHAVVIMLTARTQPDDHARALAAGADEYVVKPFRPGELLQRLSNRLAR
jgi:two-component system phosphate regulon response regulator PhoB